MKTSHSSKFYRVVSFLLALIMICTPSHSLSVISANFATPSTAIKIDNNTEIATVSEADNVSGTTDMAEIVLHDEEKQNIHTKLSYKIVTDENKKPTQIDWIYTLSSTTGAIIKQNSRFTSFRANGLGDLEVELLDKDAQIEVTADENIYSAYLSTNEYQSEYIYHIHTPILADSDNYSIYIDSDYFKSTASLEEQVESVKSIYSIPMGQVLNTKSLADENSIKMASYNASKSGLSYSQVYLLGNESEKSISLSTDLSQSIDVAPSLFYYKKTASGYEKIEYTDYDIVGDGLVIRSLKQDDILYLTLNSTLVDTEVEHILGDFVMPSRNNKLVVDWEIVNNLDFIRSNILNNTNNDDIYADGYGAILDEEDLQIDSIQTDSISTQDESSIQVENTDEEGEIFIVNTEALEESTTQANKDTNAITIEEKSLAGNAKQEDTQNIESSEEVNTADSTNLAGTQSISVENVEENNTTVSNRENSKPVNRRKRSLEDASYSIIEENIFGSALEPQKENLNDDEKEEIIEGVGITKEELATLENTTPEERLYVRLTYEDGSTSEPISYRSLSRSASVNIDRTGEANTDMWDLSSDGLSMLTYATRITEWLPWQKIVLPARKFSLSLGSYSEEADLKTSRVYIENGKPVIEWTYTVRQTGGNANTPSSIKRYFSASADSGLGLPEIISITKDGRNVKDNTKIANNIQSQEGMLESSTREISSKDAGTYVYTIKTPVVAARDYYALDINSLVEASLPRGATVTIDGETQTLSEPSTIQANNMTRIALKDTAYSDLQSYTENKINLQTSFSANRTAAGDYDPTDSTKIRWVETQTNTSREPQSYLFDLTPDESQRFESMKIYYYKPGANGYELDNSLTKTLTTPVVNVDDVPPGYMVQAVAKTTVVDNKKKHSIIGATLDSLYGDIIIEKQWTADATPKEVKFSLNGGSFNNETLTLPETDRILVKQNVPKFKAVTKNGITSYERIDYDIKEQLSDSFELINQGIDIENLHYTYTNRKKVNANSGTAPNTGQCQNYGIIDIDNLELNQIWYTYNEFGWSSNLTGHFRIPANSKGGDKFVLKLDDRVRIVKEVSKAAPWFNIHGANRADNYKGTIGRVYHTAQNELTFELLNEATSPNDYEGTFVIGNEISANVISRLNGHSYSEGRDGKQYWGVVPNEVTFKDAATTVNNIIPATLNYTSTYYGFNGDFSGCTREGTISARAHYEEPKRAELAKDINKYVIEETEDAITWEIVFNAAGENWGAKATNVWFVDRLSQTIQLYHGNSASSVPLDVEWYRTDDGDKITSTYNPTTLVKIYPAPGSNPAANMDGTDFKPVNFVRPYGVAGFQDGKVNFNYELWFRPKNMGSSTFVMRIKTKKLLSVGGYMYNEGEIWWQSGLAFRRRYVVHTPTIGIGRADFGQLFSFHIKKTGKNGDSNAVIDDKLAKFRIWNYSYSKKVETVNGIAHFIDIPKGEYWLDETDPPEGYVGYTTGKKIVVNANGRITFKENGTERDLGLDPTIPIVNTPGTPVIKPKRLHIRKVDEETGSLLRGAVFRLYTKNATEVSYDVTVGRNGNDNQNLSEFIFDGLDIKGKYILEEVAAPSGYQKKDTKRYFAFVKSGDNYLLREYTSDAFTTLAAEQPLETDASFKIDYNNNRTNQAILKKVDNEGNPIPRDAMQTARFELWIAADNGTDTLLEDGTTVKLNKYENRQYQADAEGQLKFTNLPDNTYYVKEVVAPTGYMLPSTPIAKFLVYNRTLMGVDSLPILMKNTKKSRFIIKKTNTLGQVMQGVSFTLYSDENMQTPVRGITNPQVTDSNGRIEFAGLDAGTYYLKETATLAGYKLKEDKWRVRVEKNGQVSSTLIPAPTTGTSTRSAAMSRSATLSRSADEMGAMLSDDFLTENAFNTSLFSLYAAGTERASGDTYRDAPEGVSKTENGITTSQTISKVSEGRYKVDVSITGAGMQNWNEKVDYLFMVENRPALGYARLNPWGYMDIINSESWVAIDSNPTVGVKALSWVDGKREIQSGDYATTTAGRNFKVLYEHANNALSAIKTAKPSGKRVVIFIHTLGLDRHGGGNNYNEINAMTRNDTRNYFNQIINRGDEVYVIIETLQGNRASTLPALEDLRTYYANMGVPSSNMFLLGERHSDFANEGAVISAYKSVLDPIITKYPKKEGKLKITVADNMIFDTASGISNVSTNSASGYRVSYDAASKSINATGLKFTGDGRLTFSYYVRSNTESDTAVLEQFEDINSIAKYMREGLEYRSITMPVPEVKIPSRTISLERNWNDIEVGLRQSTNVSLIANIPRNNSTKTEQTLTYRDGNASFAPVPLFDNAGNNIRYTVRESGLSSALSTDISYRIGTQTNTTGITGANGTAILSTKAGPISLTVKKIWQETPDNEQKTVKVRLLARTGNTSIDLASLGIRTGEVDLSTANSWKHTFTNLPRYYNGSEVIYEVTELAMDGSTGFTGDYDVSYSYGNGQANVINRKVHTIEVVNEKIDAYDIKVTKKDKDNNNLNGARFAILSEDGQTIVGSNASGQGGEQAGASPSYTFTRSGNHYQAGTYYIKELSAPSGYTPITDLIKVVIGTDGNIAVSLPDNSKYAGYVNFNINRSGAIPVIEVDIQNDRLFNLYIRKRNADEVTGSMDLSQMDAAAMTKLLAAFELKDANGASFTPAKTLRTDTQPQGYGRFDNLAPGEYVLEETTTPTGYIPPGSAYRIRIGRDGSITRVSGPDDLISFMPNATDGWNNINMVVKNRPIKYDFRIIKKDETGTNTITAEARFAILNSAGQIIAGQQASTVGGIANFTNTNGTHFAAGSYKLREITAPANYMRIADDLPFTINADGTVTMNIPASSPYRDFVQVNVNRTGAIPVIEFSVKNDPRSWNLIIRKRDKVEAGSTTGISELDRLTKKPLASFELLQADGSSFTPRKVDSIDISSKPEGYVRFTDIKPGRYKLRETVVPAGYEALPADLEFTLAPGGQVTWHNAGDNAAFLQVDSASGTVNLLVKNTPEQYDIKVTKKDKDNNNLNGARFAILAENGTTIIGSGANGQGGEQAGASPSFTFTRSGNHYQAGTYYIKELSAPSGYTPITDLIKVVIGTDGNIAVSLPDNSKYAGYVNFNINRNGANPVIEVDIQNDRLFTLYIRKRSADEVSGSMDLSQMDAAAMTKLLAAFELKDANGASFTPAKTLRTDTQPQGYGRFDNLAPGEYVLQETTTPTGYITPSDPYRIRIGRDGSITKVSGPDDLISFMPNATDGWNNINMVVKNRPIKYDFRIIKKDETGTNTITAEARFAILDSAGNIIATQQATTVNGIADFTNTGGTHFAAGSYKIREITAPANYVRIADDLPFTINADGTVVMNIPANSPYRDFVQVNVNRTGTVPVVEFSIKNDPRSWNLIIRKRDKVEAGSTTGIAELDRLTKKPLASFELLQADGSSFTPRKVDSIDLSTKPEGYVRFTDIKPGRYKLRETVVPAGYEALPADLEFTLAVDGQVTWLNAGDNAAFLQVDSASGAVNLLVKNTPQKYDLRIIKKDETGTNTITAQARFAILDADGRVIATQEANTVNGIANFRNTNNTHFAAGSYKIREMNPPANYVRIADDLPFTINADGTVTMNIAENSPYRDFVRVNIDRSGSIPVVEFAIKNNRLFNIYIRKRSAAEVNNSMSLADIDAAELTRLVAGFELKDADGNSFNPAKTINTNIQPQGYGAFFGIAPGEYVLQETTTPAGYISPESAYHIRIGTDGSITKLSGPDDLLSFMPNDNNGRHNINLVVKNHPIRYSFEITKTDEAGNIVGNTTPLAKFAITDEEGNILDNGNEQAEVASDTSKVSFNLGGNYYAPGTYFIKELVAPGGYNPLTQSIAVVLGTDGTVTLRDGERADVSLSFARGTDNVIKISLSIKNPRNFNLVILKRDKTEFDAIKDTLNLATDPRTALSSLTKLNGARFELLSEDGTSFSPQKVGSTANGELTFTGIMPGNYKLRELTPPTGYIGLASEYAFEVSADGSIVEAAASDTADKVSPWEFVSNGREIFISVVNAKKPKIRLRKINEAGELIRGEYSTTSARFIISQSPDGDPENTAYSGQKADLVNGETVYGDNIQGFPSGQYYLREVRAPQGYIKLFESIPFYVTEGGEIIIPSKQDASGHYVVDTAHPTHAFIKTKKDTMDGSVIIIDVTNKRVTYPNTGGMGDMPYMAMGISLVLYALYYGLSQRKRE